MWVVVLGVLAALGIMGYFALSGDEPQGSTATEGVAISAPDATPSGPSFRPTQTPLPKPEELVPDGGAVRPPVVTTPAQLQGALDEATRIVARGHVLWAGGRLPPENDVLLYDADGSELELAYTGPDGEFELACDEALAAGWSFGTEEISVVRNGEVFTLVPVLSGPLPAHGREDPPVERDLHVGFAPALVGRVTRAEGGVPVEDAEVFVASTQVPWSFDVLDASTGPDGRYELLLEGLPLQGLIVWCQADEQESVLVGPLDVAPVGVPGEAVTQNFILPPAAMLKGRVLDAVTGAPIEDATITLGSPYPALVDAGDWTFTDEQGLFELEATSIPPTGGWLIVSSADYAPQSLPLDQARQFVEVRLGPAVVVTGIVQDQLGQPVVSASVRFSFDGDTPELDSGHFDEAYTDSEGRFEQTLELVPVDHTIVRLESLAFATWQARLIDIAKPAGDNVLHVVIRVERH